MLGRHKLLLLIPAVILIPILLGMTPLNMSSQISKRGPFHSLQASPMDQLLSFSFPYLP